MYTSTLIPPQDKEQIRAELTPDKLLRKTNKGGNEIYVFHASTAPVTMQEVGRLREEAFRFYGGGTGKATPMSLTSPRMATVSSSSGIP